MNAERDGTKEECLNLLEEIKRAGYEIISYSLAPIDINKPEGIWTIFIEFRMKVIKQGE